MCVSHPVYPARNSSSGPAAGRGGGQEGAQTSPCHLSPPPGAGTWGAIGSVPPVLPPQPTFSTSALSPFTYFLSSALKGISAPKGSPFSQKCPVRALHQHTRFRLVSPAKMLLKPRDSPGKLSFGEISFSVENPSTGGFETPSPALLPEESGSGFICKAELLGLCRGWVAPGGGQRIAPEP